MTAPELEKPDLSPAVEHSAILQRLRLLNQSVSSATDTSVLVGLISFFGRAVRHSWLYRWLTKEPEPDIIVIDLRETWTVGPIIALLDRVIRFFGRGFQGSASQRLVSWSENQFRRQPISFVSTILLVMTAISLVSRIFRGDVTGGFLLGIGVLIVLAIGGLSVDLTLEELQKTRIFKLIRKVLEPPEPPDS